MVPTSGVVGAVPDMPDDIKARTRWFLLMLAITTLAFRSPLAALVRLSWNDERYAYVSLIPIISLGLIFLRREAIFRVSGWCPAGIPLIALAAWLCYRATNPWNPTVETPSLALAASGIALTWITGFVVIFGFRAFVAAAFPLSLLLLMIPMPLPVMKELTSFLQHSSAYLSGLLFQILRIPALREGLIISLPGFNIEVAEQCSGIRSTIALILASSLAGYILLRAPSNRLILILVTVPVVILKNAIRIVGICTLALYVDRGFLFGRLHHYGGLCFSLLDLLVVVPLLLRLHKTEARSATGL